MIKNLLKPARKIHKWLGYLLALQIFAWLLGGLVMSAIPLEKVHGKHLAKRHIDSPFSRQHYTADLNLLTNTMSQLTSVSFIHFLDTPVIKAIGQQTHWFNGISGKVLAQPIEQDIHKQAYLHYLGKGKIASSHYFASGPREIGYKKHVWQVTFNDWQNTTIYLNAHSGEIITIRSNIWRIFDFFWMLHIMDYDERDDFNNPLLISFATISVLFCLTGMLLLFQSRPRRKRNIRKASS
ncbi:hypothetical protein [Pseudoalteromonas sp. MMG012]|uniref:hypothetical protein n=1 Tax=Pseudoalteromonas sp. MMG012 TaxID=2822686 RepID=UPI001B3A020F|nr:hypothetical protein [Pseudoalteromonas sp. MMG012]MBQ4851679.1 hypothetical protein [Pseudoalteromonas sp. MMG012]